MTSNLKNLTTLCLFTLFISGCSVFDSQPQSNSEQTLFGSDLNTNKQSPKALWIWVAPKHRSSLPDGNSEYIVEQIDSRT